MFLDRVFLGRKISTLIFGQRLSWRFFYFKIKRGVQSCARSPRSFEGGRSMIEMLGVLAIIGVLTIGGLMGYRYAMNKHKANTILNDVSLAMADLTVQDPDGGAIARQAVAFNPDSGLAMESERTEDGNNIVYVNGVPKAVCQILIQIKPTDAYENIYDGDLNALTSCNDNQTMAFGSKDSGEPPVTPECQNDSNCAADEICQNGHCVVKPIPTDPCENVECFNGGKCDGGSCDCVNGYTGTNCEIEPDCNGSKPCTSPKQCENYICVCPMIGAANTCQTVQKINGCDVLVNKTNTACGTNGFCSNGACTECTSPKIVNTAKDGCECPKIAGCVTQNADTCACDKCDAEYIKKDGKCEKCTAPKVPNADQTACECPKIENCKEYNDSTCECNKCEDGFEVVDGKCVKNDCPTGQKSVTNYDSAGNNIGTTCCEVKEDYSEGNVNSNGYAINYSNYSIAGAINGVCCSTFNNAEYTYYGNGCFTLKSITSSYSIRTNGGVAYCAKESKSIPCSEWDTLSFNRYVSASKACAYYVDSTGKETFRHCLCSSSGDPASSETYCDL